MNFAQFLWIFLVVFHVNIVICQEEASDEITTTLATTTTQQVLEEEQETKASSDILLPTPTLNSNIVNDLLPSLKKNILLAKKEDSNVVEDKKRDFFLRRRDKDVVRNSTAAEILLKKLQSSQRQRTYHDPGFKSKKLIRVRPRVKSIEDLKNASENATNNSPILTSNVLLMADHHNHHSKIAPQGSQPFDWSARQKQIRNRFNLFVKPTSTVSTSTASLSTEKNDSIEDSTNQPDVEQSTEIHVVTSVSDQEDPETSTSYQFVSIGNDNPKDNVLELERLFLNEKLKNEDDKADNAGDKIKRKVSSNGFFLQDKKPVQVDSSITVLSDLYNYKPSTKPPTKYKAPSEPFQLPADIPDASDGLQPETLKSAVKDKAINDDSEEVIEDQHKMNLDDMIIKAVEAALAVHVPQDPMLRHRNDDPSSKVSATKSYAFEYSIQDADNGSSHSRKETADQFGVVRGVYEVIETNCVIKRIEYQADHRHGFQILGITTRTCQDEKRSTVTPTSSGFIPSPPDEPSTSASVPLTTSSPLFVHSTTVSSNFLSSSPSPSSPSDSSISQSRGATGFKGVNLIKAQPQHKQRNPLATSPPLFGGFSNSKAAKVERPKRRPEKPQPVYKHSPSPTYRPQPVVSSTSAPTYDPFSFPQSTTAKPFKDDIEELKDEIMSSIRPVTPNYDEESTIVPVYLTSEYPELRRVPKDSSSGISDSSLENEVIDRADTNADDEEDNAFKRRNMLMNIILRPGGGDKSRALPRPKVDVKADGPNVIIIRMTFPDNENIQGLRAFTPTEPEAIDQFSAINDILPPNTSVERITANSQEALIRRPAPPTPASPTPADYNYDEDYDYNYYNDIEPVSRPEREPSKAPIAPFAPVSSFKFPPPQPPVLLGQHPKVPPPRPLTAFKRSPLPPPPPSAPAPPVLPPSLLKSVKKAPKLYIQSSVSHGNRDFNYNVAVDRQDWKPIYT